MMLLLWRFEVKGKAVNVGATRRRLSADASRERMNESPSVRVMHSHTLSSNHRHLTTEHGEAEGQSSV